MVLWGHVRNGLIVADDPRPLPEGAAVRIELIGDETVPESAAPKRRRGGWWRGRVVISDGFDTLPDDMQVALGMK